MAKFLFTMFGFQELALLFRLLTKVTDFGEAWVGSAVEYGSFQEFGTQFLQERPHWRIAIPEIIAEAGGNTKLQNEILDALVDPAGDIAVVEAGATAPLVIALRIERKVKKLITSKGIIDTGNYRGSVATGPTEGDAYAKSAARAFDQDSVTDGF